MGNKFLKFLDYLTDEINKKEKRKKYLIIFYYLFLPIIFLIEYFIYKHYWKKVIIQELLTNDKIVEFFEKNEFAYVGNKIYKADLIESNEYYDRMNLDESKAIIREEYVLGLSDIFAKNLLFDIENYISIIVTTDVKTIQDHMEYFKSKIYSVEIQFYRYFFLVREKRQTINWFIINTILFGVGYLLFKRFVQ